MDVSGGGLVPAVQDVVEAAGADPHHLAVAPELLAEHAHALLHALLDGVRLEAQLAVGGEDGPLGLLARLLGLPVGDQVLGHACFTLPCRVMRSMKRWNR